jgi:hypothetical protein
VAESLIKEYISPAWFAYKGDKEGQQHFHNLANNLRLNAGLPINGVTVPLVKLPKSNAQGIIYRWLSPAWFKAKEAGNHDVAIQLNATANALRRAAGLPIE